MKDESIWVTFAAAAISGRIGDNASVLAEDVDLAVGAADKLLRELRIRRAVEREVVESVLEKGEEPR